MNTTRSRIILILIVYLLNTDKVHSKVLKKVVIFSRHNLRAPYTEVLATLTPKPWPQWNVESTYLTDKGAKLEGYMGEYFRDWLRKEQLLLEECPNENDFFAYANLKQRTKASAHAFIDKAFPNCNITTNVTTAEIDINFSPVVHNDSNAFIKQGLKEMNEKLLELQPLLPYKYLDEILDYKSSKMCQEDLLCNLEKNVSDPYLQFGNAPEIFGPLNVAKYVVDALILELYEGKEAAWGQVKTDEEWRDLMLVLIIYHDIKFNVSLIANDISRPLMKYMKNIWSSGDDKNIVTFLVGHDANIITILKAMNFRSFTLPKQFELTPIGGKIVFQKWFDEETSESYLKVDYVYQSTDQLIEAIRLTLDYPPQWFSMEMEDCISNSEGYCKWNDFEKVLDKF